MNRKEIITVLLLVATLSLEPSIGAESASQRLQQGMYAENTEGDLDKAISIYADIVKDAGPSEQITASALYHLGLCHAKKGQNEQARVYFQQIITDYPQLASFVKQAERQLKKLTPKPKNNDRLIPLLSDSFEKGQDRPEGWEQGQAVPGVTYHWDKTVASQGQASLRLSKTADRYFPIAQWTRRIEHTGAATQLSIESQVRCEDMTKAVLDALFLDEEENWISHEWVSYIGDKRGKRKISHPWKRYRGNVNIPNNTKTIVIGLQIYGPGSVWFDQLQVDYMKALVRTNKREAENRIAAGWALWRERKFSAAEKNFQEGTLCDPNNDEGYQGLGWAQFNQGKRMAAKESFDKCVALNPYNSAALNGLGWLAEANGESDKAIQWWEKAVTASKGYATASLQGLTQVYMEQKNYEKAIHYYKRWLKVDPDNQDAKAGLQQAQQALEKS